MKRTLQSISALLVAVVTMLTSPIVLAQIQPDSKALEYWNSEAYKKQVLMTGLILDEQIFDREPCKTGIGFDPVSFSVVEPLVFEENKIHPISGAWTYRFSFKRCGDITVFNVHYTARSGEVPTLAPLPPGESRVSRKLFNDVFRGIGAAGISMGAPKDCRRLRIRDSKITLQPTTLVIAGKTREGAWEEEWTARMCTAEFRVRLCLQPDQKGGTDWSANACPRN